MTTIETTVPDLSSLPGVRRATERAWEDSTLFSLGMEAVDQALGGGLAHAALHEVLARQVVDAASATGFTLALAIRAGDRDVLWARHELAVREAGAVYAPGLAELGLDPNRITLVSVREPLHILRAAHDALRAGAFGAVLIELWGKIGALDLTATRRLAMAAEDSGTTALLLRTAATPGPSAATTRWSIAASPSTPLEADAPGHPVFEAELLRHRGGVQPHLWRMEWNRGEQAFREPASLPGPVVSVPVFGPVETDSAIIEWRRAG